MLYIHYHSERLTIGQIYMHNGALNVGNNLIQNWRNEPQSEICGLNEGNFAGTPRWD